MDHLWDHCPGSQQPTATLLVVAPVSFCTSASSVAILVSAPSPVCHCAFPIPACTRLPAAGVAGPQGGGPAPMGPDGPRFSRVDSPVILVPDAQLRTHRLNTFAAPERNRVCRRCAVTSMSATRIVGLLFVLLAAGCAGLERVPPGEPPQIGVARGASVAPEPVGPPVQPMNKGSTPEPPQAGATESTTIAVQPIDPPAAPSVTPSTGQVAAKADSPAPKTPAKLVAPPVPTERVPKKESAAPTPAKQAPPPLDLKSLETRLKETEAIGVFTKLALKNQIDDLLDHIQGVLPRTAQDHPRRASATVRSGAPQGARSAAGYRCTAGRCDRGVA